MGAADPSTLAESAKECGKKAKTAYPKLMTRIGLPPTLDHMTSSHEWRSRSRCKNLSSQQADKLFFVGRGGSNKKAESFCSSCPVMGICLEYAIENDVDGFYAGTTKDQRRSMIPFRGIKVKKLEAVMPNPSKTRRIFRKVTSTEDPHDWLDQVPGPSEEELMPGIT